MSLATLEPNPVWTPEAYEETVETLAEHDDLTYRVWGGDWCGDCRAQLPDFAAALEAAEVPDERVHHHVVDQDKRGPDVEAYGVGYVPTVVVEADGTELARFVESEPVPIAVFLAERIREHRG